MKKKQWRYLRRFDRNVDIITIYRSVILQSYFIYKSSYLTYKNNRKLCRILVTPHVWKQKTGFYCYSEFRISFHGIFMYLFVNLQRSLLRWLIDKRMTQSKLDLMNYYSLAINTIPYICVYLHTRSV